MDKHNQIEWLFNEFHFTGVDYMDLATARAFDERHQRFRDFRREFDVFRSRAELKPTDVVLDLGCGTGAFLLHAAKVCKKVIGVDPSISMLAVLQEKASTQNITNVECEQAGFLTFALPEDPVDVVYSSIALHHLPDFWKAVALQRIADSLKDDGFFYLTDVVFTFPVSEWQTGTQRLLDAMAKATSLTGEGLEAKKHISSEFSTFDWFLEGVFERVGLQIEGIYDENEFRRTYVCRKTKGEINRPTICSVSESRAIDELAPKIYNIPTLILMENAARSIADFLVKNASRLNAGKPLRKVAIFCGKGANGGDGLALFRQLETRGIDCSALVFAQETDFHGDAAANLNIVKQLAAFHPQKLLFCDDSEASRSQVDASTRHADWLVDAVLGTGLKGAPRGMSAAAIAMLNEKNRERSVSEGKPVLAIDIPSGLDGDSGKAYGAVVSATATVTLGTLKRGLIEPSAKKSVGELFVGDLGFPIERIFSTLARD